MGGSVFAEQRLSQSEISTIILAVAHDEFKGLEKADVDKMFGVGQKVLLDVKGILNPADYADYSFWRL